MINTILLPNKTAVSSPRMGQVGAGSQQKEYRPKSKVIWSLLIEYEISIWTQISCLSLGNDRLLLLPYALLISGFEEWQWERFTGVLYSNHHLPLDFPFTNHVFIPGAAPPRVQEHCRSTSVIKLFQNNINLLMALTNSSYNYVSLVT